MVITSWLAAFTNKVFGKKKTARNAGQQTRYAGQTARTAEALETRTLLSAAPVAVNDTGYTLNEDDSLYGAGSVLTNDTDDDGNGTITQANLDSGPDNASYFTLNPDGTFDYVPSANFNGMDSFTYFAQDENGDISDTPATVTITVNSIDDLSTTDQNYNTSEDVPLIDSLTTGNSTTSGGTLTYAVDANGNNGTATVNPNGTFTYTPDANFHGDDSFTYTITDDDSGESETRSVYITIDSAVDLTTTDQSFSTNEDVPLIDDLSVGNSTTSGGTLTFSLASNGSHGSASVNPNGTFTYTPDDNYNGADSFTYTITDDDSGESAENTVFITVDSVGDLTATDQSFSTNEDTTLNDDLSVGNSTTSGGTLTFGLDEDGSHGSASVNSNGTFTYVPVANYYGNDSFTYTITDVDSGESDTKTVLITINSVIDLTVTNQLFNVDEDNTLQSTVATGNSTTSGGSLTFGLSSIPGHGSASISPNGALTYTPDDNFSGLDSFSYTIADVDSGENGTRIVTVNVVAFNDAPHAVNDSVSTDEDSPITINVLGNDSDADGDPMQIFAGVPHHGTAHVDDNGTENDFTDDKIVYTPAPDFNGTDSFVYILSDGQGGLNSAIVYLTVNSINDPPVTADDSYSIDEDTPLIVAGQGVLGNDSDYHSGTAGENNTPMEALVVDGPEHGDLNLSPNGAFTYTPDANFWGTDSFTYTAADSVGDTSEITTVYITVNSLNDTPTFTVGEDQTVDEDSGEQTVTGFITNFSAGPEDESSQQINFVVTNDNPSLFICQPEISPDGTLTYKSAHNANGSALITVTIHDDGGGSDTSDSQTFTINITSVNDVPDVTDDSYSTNEDSPLEILAAAGVLANDSDSHGGASQENNTPFNLCVVDSPAHGELTLNDDGSFTYTPDTDYNGTDSFTYKVIDSLWGVSNLATVTLSVISVNDAPIVGNDSYTTDEDTPLNVGAYCGVLDNDSDYHDGANSEDNTPLAAAIVANAAHGVVTLSPNGAFSYTPDTDYNGPDSFTYQVTDSATGVSDTATVYITVNSINDAPTVNNDLYSQNEDTVFNISAGAGVLANDSDSHDGTDNENNIPLTLDLVEGPEYGELTLNADGSFTYTPEHNFNGTDSFTYTLTDSLSAVSTTATVTLIVLSQNDAPVADDDCYNTNEDTPLIVADYEGVLSNDSDWHCGAPDEDNGPLVVTLVGDVEHGTLDLNEDGSFTYTPTGDYNGYDSFTYTATDTRTGVSNTATVTIKVRSVNDVPTFTVGSDEEVYEDATTTTVNLISNGGFETGLAGWTTLGIDVSPGEFPLEPSNLFYLQTGTATPISSIMGGPEADIFTVQAPSHGDFAAMSDQQGPGAAVLFQDFVVPTGVFSATLSFNIYLKNNAGEFFNPGTLDPEVFPNQQARVDVISSTGDPFTTEEEDILMNIFQTCRWDPTEFGYSTVTADLTCLLASHAGETLRLRFATANTEFYFEFAVDNVQLNVTTTEARTVPGWATDITAGGGETQNLCFNVTNDNNDMFLEQPSIDPATGNLTYTLMPNASGTALVTVTLHDNGGTRRGGVNTTAAQTFTITAAPVNDAPTFTLSGLYQEVNEDSGPQFVCGWATGINAGQPYTSDEGAQELTFTVTNDNNALFAVPPSIDPLTGDLTYTLADNAFGYANVYVTLSDNGGTDNDGSDTSATQMFTIIAYGVNDAPSFDLPAIADQTILEDAGPQTIPEFATNISAGPENESDQQLCFKIRTSDDCMFSTLPYIDPLTGDLTYEIAPDKYGDVTVTVTLRDDGGREDGGQNKSCRKTFTIHVTPVNDIPVANTDCVSTAEDTSIGIHVLDNDSDADEDPLEIFVNGPQHGTAAINKNGTPSDFTDDFIDYTPAANYNGLDSFTYMINDGHGGSVSATVYVWIGSVNDAPIANNDTYSTNEDTPLSISAAGVLGNDSDAHQGAPEEDNGPLQAVLVTGTAHGVLDLQSDGSFTYNPVANYFGTDSFTYTAVDSYTAASTTVTVFINVIGQNDLPVAQNGQLTIAEDQPGSGVVSAVDGDDPNLTYSLVGNVSHGILTLNPNGTYIYTPALNFNGTDSFTFKANDGTVDSAPATVTITVNSVNDDPLAFADSYSTNEDTQLVIAGTGVLTNDSDLHGGAPGENNVALSAVLVTGPAHGSLVLNLDGSFTYTPTSNYSGSDSFTYRAKDSLNGTSGTATVSLSVLAVNDPPTAVPGAGIVNEDQVLNASVTSTDIDGPSITYTVVGDVSHGTLNFHANGSYTYTPASNFFGTDSFTFKANDGFLDSGTATITLTVIPVNDLPVAYDDVADTTEDNPTTGSLTGTDVDNASLIYSIVGGPAHGSVNLNPATGEVTYTPAANYFGTDSFTYKVNDGTADSNTATIVVTVSAVNDAPVATDGSVSLSEDGTGSGTASANDVDNVSLTFSIVDQPVHGSVNLNPNTGAYTYTPEENYNGTDSFTFRASDGTLPSNLATVSVTITAVNDVPTATGGVLSTAEDTPATGTLIGDDVESSSLTFSVASAAAHGTVVITNAATGAYTYTPDLNYHGTDSFTFQVFDGTVNSAPATVNITVTSVNDLPTVAGDSISTLEDTPVSDTLPGGDVDADVLTFSVVSPATHGTVVITNAATGAYTYTPDLNYNGTDSFTFKLNDGTANSTTATISITITAVNDAPLASDGELSTLEDTPANRVMNGSDVDGDNSTVSIVSPPAHGTVVITNTTNGAYTYTPDLNYNGPDSFTFKLTNGGLDSNIATISINVNAVNDPPVVNDATFTLPENSANATVVGTVSFSDVDVNDPRTFSITSGNGSGTFAINPTTGQITVANKALLNFETHPFFTLIVTLSDGNAQDTATVLINLTNVDEAPTLTLPSDAPTAVARHSVIIDAAASITDPDGPNINYSGASLTVQVTGNANVNDRIEVLDQNAGTDKIDLKSGGRIFFNNVQIGTINSAGSGTSALSITFTSAATEASVNALLKVIYYRSAVSASSTDLRTVTFTLKKSDNSVIASATQHVNVVQTITARTIQLSNNPLTYINSSNASVIDSTATLSGDTSSNFDGATLSVQITSGINRQNRLRIAAVGGITVVGKDVFYNGKAIGRATATNNTFSMSFSGLDATAEAVQALLRAITFATTSANTNLSNRILTYTLTDITGIASTPVTKTVNVVTVNT